MEEEPSSRKDRLPGRVRLPLLGLRRRSSWVCSARSRSVIAADSADGETCSLSEAPLIVPASATAMNAASWFIVNVGAPSTLATDPTLAGDEAPATSRGREPVWSLLGSGRNGVCIFVGQRRRMPMLALADAVGLRELADAQLTVPTHKGAHRGSKVVSQVEDRQVFDVRQRGGDLGGVLVGGCPGLGYPAGRPDRSRRNSDVCGGLVESLRGLRGRVLPRPWRSRSRTDSSCLSNAHVSDRGGSQGGDLGAAARGRRRGSSRCAPAAGSRRGRGRLPGRCGARSGWGSAVGCRPSGGLLSSAGGLRSAAGDVAAVAMSGRGRREGLAGGTGGAHPLTPPGSCLLGGRWRPGLPSSTAVRLGSGPVRTQALAPSPPNQLENASRAAGVRTSSGARRVRSVHSAVWAVALSRLMSSQSASRTVVEVSATSIRAASWSLSRFPSVRNCSSLPTAQWRSAVVLRDSAAARVVGSSSATGALSPTSDSARDSRVATGRARPAITASAEMRVAVSVVRLPVSPVVSSFHRWSVAQIRSGVATPTCSKPSARCWLASSALWAVLGDADQRDHRPRSRVAPVGAAEVALHLVAVASGAE
jgi:hypothetical protein